MTNDMNTFELNDEQLAEVTGGSFSFTSFNPQITAVKNTQINVADASAYASGKYSAAVGGTVLQGNTAIILAGNAS